MSTVFVSRRFGTVMDFDVHLLRMTSALIEILYRSQGVHNRMQEEAYYLWLIGSGRAVLPLGIENQGF